VYLDLSHASKICDENGQYRLFAEARGSSRTNDPTRLNLDPQCVHLGRTHARSTRLLTVKLAGLV